MSLRLVPLGEGPPIPLDRPIVFIGRHADCDVRIDSKKISRRHCVIVQLHDRIVARDLGSTNGIYFGNQRVNECVIARDDEIQIANLRYKLVFNSGEDLLNAAVTPDAPPGDELPPAKPES